MAAVSKGKKQTYLVTGSAGFIGFSLSHRLLSEGHRVVGVDNLNAYYDVSLKKARLKILRSFKNFKFFRQSLEKTSKMIEIVQKSRPDRIIHLAAQAGVRYSIDHPEVYVNSNLHGTFSVLEASRKTPSVKHLIYASTSSVYGLSEKLPFREEEDADHPISFYAATKRSNELMAHSYSYIHRLPTTGLRFFTVYGPWGRPDMSLFLFTDAILKGKPIRLFNRGHHSRDFTYVGDIVEGIVRILKKPPPKVKTPKRTWSPNESSAPFSVYDIGSDRPVPLLTYIRLLEIALKKKAKLKLLPMQLGDVPNTRASVKNLKKDYGYQPSTPLKVGIQNFVDWYRSFYQI